jgi:hypothetical protein
VSLSPTAPPPFLQVLSDLLFGTFLAGAPLFGLEAYGGTIMVGRPEVIETSVNPVKSILAVWWRVRVRTGLLATAGIATTAFGLGFTSVVGKEFITSLVSGTDDETLTLGQRAIIGAGTVVLSVAENLALGAIAVGIVEVTKGRADRVWAAGMALLCAKPLSDVLAIGTLAAILDLGCDAIESRLVRPVVTSYLGYLPGETHPQEELCPPFSWLDPTGIFRQMGIADQLEGLSSLPLRRMQAVVTMGVSCFSGSVSFPSFITRQ